MSERRDLCRAVAAHRVALASRKDDDVAGLQSHSRVVPAVDEAVPFHEDVKRDTCSAWGITMPAIRSGFGDASA